MVAQPNGKVLKVLVVDDNTELCENVKDVLELYGHKVTCVNDGFRAIDVVKSDPPQVVLMDIRLPGMDGVTAFKKIKQIHPEVRAFMMSGYALEDSIREAMREGARASLKKPLDFEHLINLINTQAEI